MAEFDGRTENQECVSNTLITGMTAEALRTVTFQSNLQLIRV